MTRRRTATATFLLPGGVLPLERDENPRRIGAVLESRVDELGTWWKVNLGSVRRHGEVWERAARLPRRFLSQTLREVESTPKEG